MPPVLGPRIAIANRLVVLRGFERDDVFPVAEGDEADFFALQEFFDHQPGARGCGAASASARSCAMMTPLPAARPSALITTGVSNPASAVTPASTDSDASIASSGNTRRA